MDINESTLIKESMDCLRNYAAHAEHCLEGVCTGTKMLNRAKIFHAVALLLEHIIGRTFALDNDLFSLNLKGLLSIRSKLQHAFNGYGSAGQEMLRNFIRYIAVFIDDLNASESGTVAELDKTDILALACGLYPTRDLYFAHILCRVTVQFT